MKTKRLLFVSFVIFLFSVFFLIACAFSEVLSEAYSRTVSSFLRQILSSITGFFTFSIAEIFLFLLLVLLVMGIVLSVVFVFKRPAVSRQIISLLLCFFMLSASLFIHSFGTCYFRKSVEDNMLLKRKALSRKDLYDCSQIIKSTLETKLDSVTFGKDYASVCPYSFGEISRKIDFGYDALLEKYDFLTDINAFSKKILLSPVMTYTHLSGIYMPLTGEANINTNYPDYVVCFTMAHEKAHQRGIAGEDEANFIAFLALSESGDDYLEFSAYMSMYDYFLDAMYEYDDEMYRHMVQTSEKRVLGEMYAYSVFFDKYRNSTAAKVSDTVNDTYIKVMGDEKGVESYGNVVELVYAYINKNALP